MNLKPPKDLSRAGKAMWRRIITEYDLGDASLDVLHEALKALDVAETARAVVEAEGVTLADRFGQPKPHPAMGVYKGALELYYKGMSLLRLDLEPLGDIGRPAGR